MMRKSFLYTIILLSLLFSLTLALTGCVKKEVVSDNVVIASQNQQVILEEVSKSSYISESELKSHNSVSNCWVAIGVEVYDITSYVGNNLDKNLEEYCGTMFFENVLDEKNIAISDVQEFSEYVGDLNE